MKRGHLRRRAVACRTTYHYHPCSNLGVSISEGCFIFDFASLPLELAAHLAYLVPKSGRKTSIIIIIIIIIIIMEDETKLTQCYVTRLIYPDWCLETATVQASTAARKRC